MGALSSLTDPASSDKQLIRLQRFFLECKPLIEALEECHKSWGKFFGQCNDIKQELNLCLRSERLDRTKQNREDAKQKRAKIQKVWAEIDQES